MSLRALRTLIAVAKFGSFARAAEAVCLTQPAVSLHIRSLEADFNASLFDRSRRVPVLTDAGHRAVERAREIVALYDGIDAELHRMRVRVQTEMELDSRDAILEMVASGLGVVPLSRPRLAGLATPGGLTCLPFGTPQCTRNVVLLEREDRPAGRTTERSVMRPMRKTRAHQKIISFFLWMQACYRSVP